MVLVYSICYYDNDCLYRGHRTCGIYIYGSHLQWKCILKFYEVNYGIFGCWVCSVKCMIKGKNGQICAGSANIRT